MGGFEVPVPAGMESLVKYHSERICGLTPIPMKLGGEQCMLGSLAGAAFSQIVTEKRKGRLNAVGNRVSSVRAQAGFTVSLTRQAVSKEGSNDPVVPCGRAVAQRIKGTLGITG